MAEGSFTSSRGVILSGELSVAMKGPKGDPGEPGPQGEKGPKGDKGDKGDSGDWIDFYNIPEGFTDETTELWFIVNDLNIYYSNPAE